MRSLTIDTSNRLDLLRCFGRSAACAAGIPWVSWRCDMITPSSLRILVADGDPHGLRVVEGSNWIGKGLGSSGGMRRGADVVGYRE